MVLAGGCDPTMAFRYGVEAGAVREMGSSAVVASESRRGQARRNATDAGTSPEGVAAQQLRSAIDVAVDRRSNRARAGCNRRAVHHCTWIRLLRSHSTTSR